MPDEILALEIAYIKDSLAEIKQQLAAITNIQRDVDRLKLQHDERCNISTDTAKELQKLKDELHEYKAFAKETFMPKDAPGRARDSFYKWGTAVALLITLAALVYNTTVGIDKRVNRSIGASFHAGTNK